MPPADQPPRRLRVLHLGFEDHLRPGSGGGSARNQQVNRRLAPRHDITVLTASFRGARDRTEDGVRYVHVGLPIGYFTSILSYFAALPFAARRHPADLVIEEFAAPFSSVLVPLWSRRPTLAVVQWLNSREKSRQYRLPFSAFERAGVRTHRRLVAMSDDLRDQLHAANPGAHVDVVPNGVEPLAFQVAAERGDDVVFLGRLEQAQKGIDLLLEAYALAADRVDGRLVLAGDGPDRARLARQADVLGIGPRVHFPGRVSGAEKYRLLAGARLVAMPSRYETFGMVAVEALASGSPVLAFAIPCLRSVVPPQCGRLVPRFDVPAYAEAMVEMYADRAQADRMGAAGRVFARQFDWDRIADEQEQAYLAAVAAGPATLRSLLVSLARAPARTAADAAGRTAPGSDANTANGRAAEPASHRPERGRFVVAAPRDAAGPPELVGVPAGPYVFLSPHLDDAVLSCAALMTHLTGIGSVTVATLFTAAAPPPYTLSARTYLRQCGQSDAMALYAERRAEDARVLAAIGVEHVHLGEVEALFRRRPHRQRPQRRRARWLPELGATYPTYRLHVLHRRVSAADETLMRGLAQRLGAVLADRPGATLLAPLGVGGHVDHRVARMLGRDYPGDVVHYADLPYALTEAPDRELLDRYGLCPVAWTRGLGRKPALLAGYATQVDALFPAGQVPELPEVYYVPADRLEQEPAAPDRTGP